jgi:hypothetical protein
VLPPLQGSTASIVHRHDWVAGGSGQAEWPPAAAVAVIIFVASAGLAWGVASQRHNRVAVAADLCIAMGGGGGYGLTYGKVEAAADLQGLKDEARGALLGLARVQAIGECD